MQKLIYILLILGGALCSALSTTAQKAAWADIGFAKQYEAWLSSSNASGLKYSPIDTISTVELYTTFRKGDFINYNQSNNSYNLGGQAESYFRLNPKVVFYGNICYNNFNGKNMGGSAFIQPEVAPFNIVEYADSTRGEKKMERYKLAGATAVSLNNKLSLGGRIDYTAANYSKVKDLRHTNKLMDLNLSIGAMYKIGNIADLGLNYIFRKRVEELTFKVYGKTDEIYNSLISWGAFWGATETFSDNGFTGSGDNKPLTDKYNGASLQIGLNLSSRLDFFNEFSYMRRQGYFGIDSYSSIIYTEHSSNIIQYNGSLSLKQKRILQVLNLKLNYEKLENLKNNYSTIYVPEQSISYTEYYEPSKVLNKTNTNLTIEYQAHIDYNNFNPKWSFGIGADFRNRELTASIYPYYRKQSINQTIGRLSAERNFIKGINMYNIRLGGQFSSGSGTVKDDGTYLSPTEGQSPPRSTDFNLYREYEYLTINSIKANVGLGYSRLLTEHKIRGYARIDYQFTKAQDIKYIDGDTFNELSLVVGCSF